MERREGCSTALAQMRGARLTARGVVRQRLRRHDAQRLGYKAPKGQGMVALGIADLKRERERERKKERACVLPASNRRMAGRQRDGVMLGGPRTNLAMAFNVLRSETSNGFASLSSSCSSKWPTMVGRRV